MAEVGKGEANYGLTTTTTTIISYAALVLIAPISATVDVFGVAVELEAVGAQIFAAVARR